MFTWEQVEALNEVMVHNNGNLPTKTVDTLRRLSLQLGMMVVAHGQERSEPRVETRLKLFPSRLRSLREKMGLTQTDVGKLVKVTKQSVYLYEAGGAFPGLDTFARLCKALDTSPDYLLGWGMESTQVADAVEEALSGLGEPAVRRRK